MRLLLEDESGVRRRFGAVDLPLSLGGGLADVAIPGVEGTLGHLGYSEGRFFFQPEDEADLTHTGRRSALPAGSRPTTSFAPPTRVFVSSKKATTSSCVFLLNGCRSLPSLRLSVLRRRPKFERQAQEGKRRRSDRSSSDPSRCTVGGRRRRVPWATFVVAALIGGPARFSGGCSGALCRWS